METGTNGTRALHTKTDNSVWNLIHSESAVEYRQAPITGIIGSDVPVWRVRFDPVFDPSQHFGLDINGEVVLGRLEESDIVGLNAFDAEELGVSRRHLMLRPSDSKLYIVDLGSTNGTALNGRTIGINTPYTLSNGDLLSLGQLEFVVRIIKRPTGRTELLHSKENLADMLLPIGKAITSHLTVENVLKQALEVTVSATGVEESSIWLVDEKSGELFLEADRGIVDDEIRHMRLSVTDTLAGQVIETGKPLYANREAGPQIKLKTGYLVDAVIYVPLALGGVTFGVLSAAHRATGKAFGAFDEKVMMAIADFTAIAVQNSRRYEATKHVLTSRVKLVTALNSVMSYDLKKLLNTSVGYAGLLKSYQKPGDQTADMVDSIVSAGNEMLELIDHLLETTTLGDMASFHFAMINLIDVVASAVDDTRAIAGDKAIELDVQYMGDSYLVWGDENFLYRSVLNLLNNAVRFSPNQTKVSTTLAFSPHDIIIRVRDTGPGIPQDQIPDLFNKYFRSTNASNGHEGLGLGLELVRATTEAHKGSIVVRNLEPQGAEFMITLPNTERMT